MPSASADATAARLIASALLQAGIRERVVEKLLGANFRRVFAATWT